MSARAKTVLFILGAYVASRVFYYALFPFHVDYLPWLNQLLDVEILKHDLLNGLWYLHATPPLYNAYVGLMLKLFSDEWLPIAFAALHTLLGVGITLMVWRISLWLGAGERWALVAALVSMCNPILFRFEVIPFYAFPLAFLLVASVYVLIQTLESRSKLLFLAAMFLPVVIVLFRNFFHVIFFLIPVVVLVAYAMVRLRIVKVQYVVIVALLCIGIGLLPSIKNFVEYNMFASSTWQGMQLYSMTYLVPKDKIESLVRIGEITPLSLLPRFNNPDMYYAYYKEPVRNEIPALDALYKTGTEFGNFNNRIFIRTSEEYGQNALTIMSYYPWYFVPKFVNSAYIFFGAANYRFFTSVDEWMVFDGPWYQQMYQAIKYFIQPALLAALFFAILGYLVWLLYGAMRTRKWSNHAIVYTYILFIFVYVFGVANVVELGENFTARVPIDPLLTVCAVMLFSRLATRRPSAVV